MGYNPSPDLKNKCPVWAGSLNTSSSQEREIGTFKRQHLVILDTYPKKIRIVVMINKD